MPATKAAQMHACAGHGKLQEVQWLGGASNLRETGCDAGRDGMEPVEASESRRCMDFLGEDKAACRSRDMASACRESSSKERGESG